MLTILYFLFKVNNGRSSPEDDGQESDKQIQDEARSRIGGTILFSHIHL